MKKIAAWLLMVCIMVTGLPATPLFAADMVLTKSTRALTENLEDVDEFGEEETAVEWNVAERLGLYSLTYYIGLSNGGTQKVELDFNVGESSVDVKTRVVQGGANVSLNYYKKIYPYIQDRWTLTENIEEFEDTIDRTNNFEQGSSLKVGNSLKIRYRLRDGIIKVWTNQIHKGDITPFTLVHEDGQESTVKVLTGIKDFKSEPLHLNGSINDSLVSIDIPNANIANPDGSASQEDAGSKPGIKVSFKQPRIIADGASGFKEFKEISDGSDEYRASLVMRDYVPSNAIQVNFSLTGDTSITGGGTGKLMYTAPTADAPIGTNSIYFVKDKNYVGATDQDKVVEWPTLDSSRIMEDMVLQISGFETMFQPENIGYTYVDYTVKRINKQDASLSIKPYKGLKNTKVIYHVYTSYVPQSSTSASWGNPIVSHTYIPSQNQDEDSIAVSVPFNELYTDQYYKIEIEVFGKRLYSQIIHYTAQNDVVIPPPNPQIMNIDNIFVIPGLEKGKQPEAIGFDIEWSAPKNKESNPFLTRLLEEGKLYYEMLLYEDKNITENSRRYSKVFEVSLEGDDIVVKPYLGKAGKDGYDGTKRYYKSTESFSMEKVILKKNPDAAWEQLMMPSNYTELSDYPQVDAVTVTDDLDYTIPGTYYVTMRAIYDPDAVGAKLSMSTESNPVPVSLDVTREIIPVPTVISDKQDKSDETKIIQDITFNNVDIQSYVENMLEPAGWSLSETNERTYEVYLYQENSGINVSEENLLNAVSLTQEDGKVSLSDADKQMLRQGKVFKVEYKDTKNSEDTLLKYINLDPNQVYYVRIRVRLDAKHPTKEPRSEYSLFSRVHTFTTYTRPQPPTPDDNTPPAPENIYIVDQPNNTTVTIGWDKAEFVPDTGTEIYYEFLRATDKKATTEELSIKDINTLLRSQGYFEGFRYRESETYIKKFDKTVPDTGNPWVDLEPKQLTNKFQLTDESLSPNTIYYYYVRTVYVVNGEAVRSSWVMVPVTTSPVNRPIKLKVEDYRVYSYNTKDEVVVSFLAPVPEGAKIPQEYDFEIGVKGEKDDDYRLDYPVSRLTSKEAQDSVPEGYVHMVYKITGLKPGTRYDIKVRIVDKTKPKETGGDYPRSLYSEKVTYRTEFDQDEQDKDDKYDEYLKMYDSAVEKLRRRPYWPVEDDAKSSVYKYRKSYINTEIAIQSEYTLAAEEGSTRLYYYFPASMLDEAAGQGTTLKAVIGGESVYIRPYTLTQENKQIKEALERVQEKRIEDYYICFEFTTSSKGLTIGGEEAISPKITVNMEVVQLNKEDIIIEDDIMDELNSLIEKERLDVIKELKKQLDRGRLENDKLQKIIDDAVASITKAHKRDVERILERSDTKIQSIDELEKPMLIVSRLESYMVQAYYMDREWTPIPSYAAYDGFAVEANKLGSYVFTGNKEAGGAVQTIPQASGMISKYTLTDFFKIDDVGMLQRATKRQVYGALARILGAKRGSDYQQYLQSKGIKGITSVGLDSPMRQDESIYVIMQAYEKIYNKKVEAIKIKNKQGIQNIGAFQPYYRNYVYAAVELKIVEPTDKRVLPSKYMTAKEILEMLSKMVNR